MKLERYLKQITIFALILLLTSGCSTESNEDVQADSNHTISTADEPEKPSDDVWELITPIVMEMNGVEVKAHLNGTLTAQDFIDLLPYSVTVSRASDDLCGTATEELNSDPQEGKHGWEIGEIGWFGGWFTILVDHEENFADMDGVMVIGKVDDEYLDIIGDFRGRVDITVSLAQ